ERCSQALRPPDLCSAWPRSSAGRHGKTAASLISRLSLGGKERRTEPCRRHVALDKTGLFLRSPGGIDRSSAFHPSCSPLRGGRLAVGPQLPSPRPPPPAAPPPTPLYTQPTRPLGVTTPLGPDVLLLEKFTGEEAISEPFRFRLDVLALTTTPVAF